MAISFGVNVEYFVIKSCSIQWQISRSQFPANGFIFVLSGSAAIEVNDQFKHVKAGDAVFFKKGCIRSGSTSEGMRCVALDFSYTGNDGIDCPSFFTFLNSDELQRLFREMRYHWLQKADGYRLKCAGLLHSICYELFYEQQSSGQNIQVERMKRYIMDHSMESVSVAEVAGHLGLSPVYCGALFREHVGYGILQFVHRGRVKQAAMMLLEGDMPLADIAESCGYADVFYFSRSFKKYTGDAPSVYRLKYANDQDD